MFNVYLYAIAAVLGIAAFIARYLTSRWEREKEDNAIAAANGCKELQHPGPYWPNPRRIYAVVKAVRQGHILKYVTRRFESIGITRKNGIFWMRQMSTLDPANIEAMLSSQFKDFELGPLRQGFLPALGHGIFTQDGPAWKHSRDMLRPQFARGRLQDISQLNGNVDDLLDVIPQGRAVDLQPLFFRLTLDTSTALLFGQSVDSLKGPAGDDGDTPINAAFTATQNHVARWNDLAGSWWLLGASKFRKDRALVHAFLDEIIARALAAEKLQTSEMQDKKTSFLDSMLCETKDPVELRSACLHILLAGRDTTACLLSWIFFILARHPQVYARLREEVGQVLGARRPAGEDMKKLTYLNQVIKEVLRLYPPVPANVRVAARTTTLPKGGGPDGNSPILIRKGEIIGYLIYSMHRRKDLYGEDAECFRPERWDSTDEDSLSKRIGYGYLPFQGGPRICLGQEFALLETALAVARIVQRYPQVYAVDKTTKKGIDLDSNERVQLGDEPHALALVLSSRDGCWVRFDGDGQ